MSFSSKLSKIINTNQTRSVILTGNVYDLYFNGKEYVPLIEYLSNRYHITPRDGHKGLTQVIYEINNPIIIKEQGQLNELKQNWNRYGAETKLSFDDICLNAINNPTGALEFLRQLTYVNRLANERNQSNNDLLIIIESADMLVPEEDISRMSIADKRRIAILHDWFSSTAFMNGNDSVVLISESRNDLNSRVSKLPQMISVDIPFPDKEQREHFIKYGPKCELPVDFAKNTAGLSIHAIRQLMCTGTITQTDVIQKVEEYIISQLGDTVEFKKPSHTLDDVIGFSRLKSFLRNELIPRIKMDGEESIAGAAVGGPIGGGKTFIFEAMASELGMPVLVLKNLRSQWFGQTDVIFERLQRTIRALDKALIFVDEADTQFGRVSEGTHDTEKRLTGKVQKMMSDTKLRGKVIWLLMTARINQLSPDIRRPGRVGDLIIPVLDPHGEDAKEFLKWVLKDIETTEDSLREMTDLLEMHTEGFSAAAYAALRSRIKAKECKSFKEIEAILEDMVLPDIEETREYQTLQAKVNCTRQSLLFDEVMSRKTFEGKRRAWKTRIKELEKLGVD